MTFSRSMRSLDADSFRRSLWGLAMVIALLIVAAIWFCWARVELYATAANARLQADREVHPVAALLAGRISRVNLAVGRTVEAGQVLVELDTEAERLRVEEEKSRVAAHTNRLAALRNEMTAEEQSWLGEQKAARVAIDEARAKDSEAQAAARFSEGEADRIRRMDAQGLVPKTELARAEAEAQQKRAAATALQLAVSRMEAEVHSKEKNHLARLAKLQSDSALLEGEIQTISAAIKRYEYDIEKRLIRAPISGRLGEVADLRIGSFVDAGEKLAAIIPAGDLKAVAYFPPLAALGRIRAGQPARLRLDGFPWTQYGSLKGAVASVANEPRDGLVRVDLTIDPASAPLIPVQHGLPGSVEIEVDRVTPAILVLRAAGKLLSPPQRQATR